MGHASEVEKVVLKKEKSRKRPNLERKKLEFPNEIKQKADRATRERLSHRPPMSSVSQSYCGSNKGKRREIITTGKNLCPQGGM